MTAFEKAFAAAGRRLLLSGTPFRSDATAIPGVRYGRDGVAQPDFSYGYDDAVRDRICRPVTFIPFDGTMQWRSGDDVIEAGFNDVLTGRESSRRYRTAISLELENGLPLILREAHQRLEALRRTGGHRDAGGLVIAADAAHAGAVAKVLREVSGEAPVVVVHTDPKAHAKLDAFRKSSQRWIVAVNMVSEGVDIPRLRVGVYATAAKTALIFRQIVGRFVRVIPGRPVECSWLYLPGDPVLQGHAADVERELLHVLAPATGRGGPARRAAGPDRDRAERDAGLRAAGGRRGAAAGALRRRARGEHAGRRSRTRRHGAGRAGEPGVGVRAPQAPARGPAPARLRPRAVQGPGAGGDQRLGQPRGRRQPGAGRDHRSARALDRSAVRAAARRRAAAPVRRALALPGPGGDRAEERAAAGAPLLAVDPLPLARAALALAAQLLEVGRRGLGAEAREREVAEAVEVGCGGVLDERDLVGRRAGRASWRSA